MRSGSLLACALMASAVALVMGSHHDIHVPHPDPYHPDIDVPHPQPDDHPDIYVPHPQPDEHPDIDVPHPEP
eukprot:CAMPEP_0197472004 /NCGR_PEP_ID=MMETSP1309-20131121/3105_1 /TAXON_ID=464262 /ORGANISM="Genus nov. species nov., Strain RCC998" /LENGTH=71 /DNA_ID=CAMNT_0043010209 /DNA_START=660 /DNA_END=871 /DNA_ORIENTATION=+